MFLYFVVNKIPNVYGQFTNLFRQTKRFNKEIQICFKYFFLIELSDYIVSSNFCHNFVFLKLL